MSIVKPHNKLSRLVTLKDIERVREDAKTMTYLCNNGRRKAYAIAHQQIDDKDPLRFFVMANGEIYINPVITRHLNYTVDSKEGCISFPEETVDKVVQRWRKIEVTFDDLCLTHDNAEVVKTTIECAGKEAFIFQHEIDHFDCKYVYERSE